MNKLALPILLGPGPVLVAFMLLISTSHFNPLMQGVSVMNDEADEISSGNPNTRTLENPQLLGSHYADTESIDHNLYIKGDLAYLANYCSGLRILDATQMMDGKAPEVAFFDACDYCDSAVFSGVWSNYPYFDSRNIVVSSIELGLFILRPHYSEIDPAMQRP